MQPGHRDFVRRMLEDLYGQSIADPEDEGEILVALNATGDITGLIALQVRPWADGCLTAPVAYVEAWYVAPDYRRQGIGTALMRAAEDWARTKGMTEIGSDADVTNTASLAAHARLGWQASEQVQHFRRDLAGPGPVLIAGPYYDFAALHALILRNFDYMDARIDPLSSTKAMTAADLAALDAVLVIEVAGAPVACMSAIVKPDCLYVGRLAVDAQYRGQGLARRLMDAAERLAMAQGILEIELGSRVELTENHAVFLKMGFVKVRDQSHRGYDRPTSFWFRKKVTS